MVLSMFIIISIIIIIICIIIIIMFVIMIFHDHTIMTSHHTARSLFHLQQQRVRAPSLSPLPFTSSLLQPSTSSTLKSLPLQHIQHIS